MPSLVIHIAVGKKIADILQINDKKTFLEGCVLPDYELKNFHFKHTTAEGFPNVDVEKFISSQKENSLLFVGKLTHMLTDYFFNDQIVGAIIRTGLPYSACHKILVEDFTNLNSFLTRVYNINTDKFIDYFTDYESLDKKHLSSVKQYLVEPSSKPFFLTEEVVINFIENNYVLIVESLLNKMEQHKISISENEIKNTSNLSK